VPGNPALAEGAKNMMMKTDYPVFRAELQIQLSLAKSINH